MPSLGEMYVSINGDTRDFDRSINGMQRRIGTLGTSFSQIFGTVAIGTLISKGVSMATDELGNMIKAGFDFNSTMEQNLTSFEVMLGDLGKAESMMKSISQFASVTPFELTNLSEGAKTLLNFGVEAENIMPSLKTLGDISGGNAERFKSLAIAFGQIKANGRLMGQEVLQMVNNGFNPLQAISEQTGKSMAELKKDMADGKVTFKDVALAMQQSTQEGGKFFGMMEKQSQTMAGRLSTLRDAFNSAMGRGLEPFYIMIRDDLLPIVIEFAEKGSQSILDFSNNVIIASRSIKNSFKEMRNSFASLNSDLSKTEKNSYTILDAIKEHFDDWGMRTIGTFNDVMIAIGKLSVAFAEMLNMVKSSVQVLWNSAEVVGNLGESIRKASKLDFKGAKKDISDMKKDVTDLKQNLSEGWESAIKAGENISGAFSGIIFGESYKKMLEERKKIKQKAQREEYNNLMEMARTQGVGRKELDLLTFDTIDGLDDFETKVGEKMKSVGETLSDIAQKYWSFDDIFGVTQIKKLSFKDLRYRMEQRLKVFERFQSALKSIGEKFGKGSLIYGEILQRGVSATGEALALAQMPSDVAQQYSQRFGRTIGMSTGFAGEQMAFNRQQEVINQEINITIPQQNDAQAVVNEVVRRLKIVGAV